jgi:hypothetical protein
MRLSLILFLIGKKMAKFASVQFNTVKMIFRPEYLYNCT